MNEAEEDLVYDFVDKLHTKFLLQSFDEESVRLMESVWHEAIDAEFSRESEQNEAARYFSQMRCQREVVKYTGEHPLPRLTEAELRGTRHIDPQVGDVLAGDNPAERIRVELVEKLGSGGGQADIFRATSERQWTFRGPFAVKVYRRHKLPGESIPTRALGDLLFRELDALRGISHPNVVSVHDGFRTHDGLFWLSLELVDGHNLKKWKDTERSQGMMVRELAGLIGFYAQVLAELHKKLNSNKLIHGDIKPSNILGFTGTFFDVTKSRLADFGTALLAELDGDTKGSKKTQHGTPGYMAPEQLTEDSEEGWHRTAAIDVFSLAMTFLSLVSPTQSSDFQRLVGSNSNWIKLHSLWNGRNNDLLTPMLSEQPRGLPSTQDVATFFKQLDLPGLVDHLLPSEELSDLASVLKACLAEDPRHRIQTPGEMALLLATFLADYNVIPQLNSVIKPQNTQPANAESSSPKPTAKALSFWGSWKREHRRLRTRYSLWGATRDAVALGAYPALPAGLLLSVHAMSCIAVVSDPAVTLLIAVFSLLSALIGTLVTVFLSIQRLKKLRRQKTMVVQTHSSNSGVPRANVSTGKHSLLRWSKQTFCEVIKMSPAFGFGITLIFLWPLARLGAGGLDSLQDLKTGDVAQMTAEFCLLASASASNARFRWMAFPAIVAYGLGLMGAFSTATPTYDWWAVFTNHAFHGALVLAYFSINYWSVISKGMKGATPFFVNAEVGRESPESDSVIYESLKRATPIFAATLSAKEMLERDIGTPDALEIEGHIPLGYRL